MFDDRWECAIRNRVVGYDWEYHDKVEAGVRRCIDEGDGRPVKMALGVAVSDEEFYGTALELAMWGDVVDEADAKKAMVGMCAAAARVHTWAKALALIQHRKGG